MNLKEEIIKAIEGLPDEALQGVLDYVQFIKEPEEVEPSEEELKAIEKGEKDFAKGDFATWREVK